MEFKEILKMYNLSQTNFAKKFNIPLRTVQNWVSGSRKPPEYLLQMFETIFKYENQSPN